MGTWQQGDIGIEHYNSPHLLTAPEFPTSDYSSPPPVGDALH